MLATRQSLCSRNPHKNHAYPILFTKLTRYIRTALFITIITAARLPPFRKLNTALYRYIISTPRFRVKYPVLSNTMMIGRMCNIRTITILPSDIGHTHKLFLSKKKSIQYKTIIYPVFSTQQHRITTGIQALTSAAQQLLHMLLPTRTKVMCSMCHQDDNYRLTPLIYYHHLNASVF